MVETAYSNFKLRGCKDLLLKNLDKETYFSEKEQEKLGYF